MITLHSILLAAAGCDVMERWQWWRNWWEVGRGGEGSRRGTDGGEVPILLANTQCTNKTTWWWAATLACFHQALVWVYISVFWKPEEGFNILVLSVTNQSKSETQQKLFLSLRHFTSQGHFKNQSNSKPRRTWIRMRKNGIKITTKIDQSIIFWMRRYVKTRDCKSVFSILFVLLLIGKYWNPIEISKSSQLANFWNRCRLINTILICCFVLQLFLFSCWRDIYFEMNEKISRFLSLPQ